MTLSHFGPVLLVVYVVIGVFVEWRAHEKYSRGFLEWLHVPYSIGSKLYIALGPIAWPLIAYYRIFKAKG